MDLYFIFWRIQKNILKMLGSKSLVILLYYKSKYLKFQELYLAGVIFTTQNRCKLSLAVQSIFFPLKGIEETKEPKKH